MEREDRQTREERALWADGIGLAQGARFAAAILVRWRSPQYVKAMDASFPPDR